MELDRNYMGFYPMMNKMDSYNTYCPKYENKMMECPMMHNPYMHGKCMGMWDNNMCYNHMNTYDKSRGDMYNMQYMEPLENLCGKTHKIFMGCINKSMQKIIMENMGMMPKAISKEKFNKEMNDMLCEIMKNEKEIKKLVVVERTEDTNEEESRVFCPFCHGILRDTLGILFITELLRNGCVSCY